MCATKDECFASSKPKLHVCTLPNKSGVVAHPVQKKGIHIMPNDLNMTRSLFSMGYVPRACPLGAQKGPLL
jgi:adenine-specific DNA methylase